MHLFLITEVILHPCGELGKYSKKKIKKNHPQSLPYSNPTDDILDRVLQVFFFFFLIQWMFFLFFLKNEIKMTNSFLFFYFCFFFSNSFLKTRFSKDRWNKGVKMLIIIGGNWLFIIPFSLPLRMFEKLYYKNDELNFLFTSYTTVAPPC